jgi:SPP1 gp7 family putative phage head morphogenesis protein
LAGAGHLVNLAQRFDLAAAASAEGIRRSEVTLRPIDPRLGSEVEYIRILTRMLNGMLAEAKREILPVAAAERRLLTMDSLGDRISGVFGLFRRLAERLKDQAQGLARGLVEVEAARHTERFREVATSALGVDLKAVIKQSDIADVVQLAAERNASLIDGLAADTVKKVEQATLENLTSGGTARQLEKQLTDDLGVAKRRARFIARDQSAKLTGDLNRIRQTQVGVKKYRWATARDERVRASHRANEGKTFSWDSPPSTGHPGSAPNCRCRAIAVIEIDGVDFSSRSKQQGDPAVWANPSAGLTPAQRSRALREQRKFQALRAESP